ncbi:MAG: DEAD/DEAH box helicase [Deltaproteobacteria bacterium]|nr:DEAD/DEAH box helicase [Deltaproteobacteria bacterium]
MYKKKTMPRKKRFQAKLRLKIKPSADSALKKIFTSIGVPEKVKFKPDPFQLDAVQAIQTADCLVTVPTGAGKTWIAEKAIEEILKKGGRSWYASPLKALTNSKYSEFAKIFGPKNLGILTGDRKENPDAPVITGTTEILRNQLYDAMHRGETLNTDLVILDEAHFLGDQERGVVWEEIMIYLPARIPLLMLSATIGNAEQIAAWLESIRLKKCTVIEETKRPVPLFPIFFHPSGKLLPLTRHGNRIEKRSKAKNRLHAKVISFLDEKKPPRLAIPGRLPPFSDIMKVMKKYELLPAIFFLKSRADCDNALKLCASLLPQDRKRAIRHRIGELVRENTHIALHPQLQYLKSMGVGAHHSGQLPAWKLLLETLMTEGLLDAVFATSTVAAGVNFPARTIVMLNSDRFNGREFIPLSPNEFHQMTGRAGRRGMDKIGFAMLIPGKFMDLPLTARLVKSDPSQVLSQIKINFSMVLNLLLSHTPNQIEDLMQQSFATYLIRDARKKTTTEKSIKLRHKALEQDFERHLKFLEENGYVTEDGALTDVGFWASKLRVDHPLLIAEGLRIGIFPEDDPALLAAIIASFVNEKDTDENIDKNKFPQNLVETYEMVKNALQPFAKKHIAGGFDVRPLFLKPAAAVYYWACEKPWEDALAVAATDEGSLAMLILRTADNLRHIRALADVFPIAARNASEAIELIVRDPVITEYDDQG